MRLFIIFLTLPFFIFAQFGNEKDLPAGYGESYTNINLNTVNVEANLSKIEELKKLNHCSYISAIAISTQIRFSDFKLSQILKNGDKIYQLMINSPNALGMMIYLENFKLESGAKLWLYNLDKTSHIGAYSQKDNYTKDQTFMTSFVNGNQIIVEYLEPKAMSTPNFTISRVYHYFRGLKSSTGYGGSASCMLNAGCTEGHGYDIDNFATCRILVTGSGFSGWCSGTLMNNTLEDGTPYILTANHCSANSTLSDLTNWEYHFLYQSIDCNDPSKEPIALKFKGSTAPAYSGSDNGDYSSDFLLLKLNSTLPFNVYDFSFSGWDKSPTASGTLKGFHHPQGDIKKVSTSSNPIVASYQGNVSGTHFQIHWKPTVNGQSVTEGGSSGSGIFNSSGLLIGTLTGGASLCSSKNDPDFYGRLYEHWNRYNQSGSLTDSKTGTVERKVQSWLDPNNSNTSWRSAKASELGLASISISAEEQVEINRYQNEIQIIWNEKNFSINVYDLMGKLVHQQSNQSRQGKFDISKINQGTYIIELSTGNKRVVKKLSL